MDLKKVGSPPWTLFDTGSFMQLECTSSPYLVLSLFADYRLVAVNLRTLTWLAISIVIRSSPNSTGPE